MNRTKKFQKIFWCLPPHSYYFIFLLSVIFLSESVSATIPKPSLQIAQQPASTSVQNNSAVRKVLEEGLRLLSEAKKLGEQGTAQSQKQAITTYQEVLKVWRQKDVRAAFSKESRTFEITTLLGIGTAYSLLNQNQSSLEYFQQGLIISRELNNRKSEAQLLFSIAGAYSNLGEQIKALENYNQALSIFRGEKEPYLEAITLTSLANVYIKLGETQKAIAAFNQGLQIQRATKDLSGQADTLDAIGLLYANLGEAQKSLVIFNQALEIQKARKDLAGQADILSRIGLVYSVLLQDEKKALATLNQALELQKTAQEKLSGIDLTINLLRQANILTSIAATYSSVQDFQKTLSYQNQARLLFQKAGRPQQEANILYQISLAYNQLGEKQKALNSLNEALSLQRTIKEPAGEAVTLTQIAEIYHSAGEPQKALDTLNQALDIQQRINDRSQQGVTLNTIAQVYSSLGNYQLSIDSYNQALELFQTLGNKSRQALVLDNIGTVYRKTEDYQSSLDYYKQALKISRENGLLTEQFSVLGGMVRVYESLKDYPKALDAANQFLALSRQLNNNFFQAAAYVYLGRVYQAAGDYQKALSFYNQSLSLWRKIGSLYAEGNTLYNLGRVYNSLKQPQQAIEVFHQELVLRRNLGDKSGEAETLYNLAVIERDRGNLKDALTQIKAVIEIVENIRTKVTREDLRTAYFASSSVQDYYKFYIDLLMQLHKQNLNSGYAAQALQVSESSRARSLVELLTEANVQIRKGVDPKLLTQEKLLQQRLDAKAKLLQELPAQNQEQAAPLKKEIDNLLNQYQELQAKIRANSPKYGQLKYPKPLTLSEIQQQLDKDTLLLQYSLGEKRSYLWAVSFDSLDSYELPGREQIEKAARNFYSNIQNPIMLEVYPETAQIANELTQFILTPVAKKLAQKRLLIVGDGTLQYIPFAALPEPAKVSTQKDYQPLLVNHEIVSLPSASTLAILREELKGRKKAPKTLAILADPVFSIDDERVNHSSQKTTAAVASNLDLSALNQSLRNIKRINGLERLPGTRAEAQEILKLVSPANRLSAFDFDANINWVSGEQLNQYRLLHFATHGFLNSINPELSGIVLSLIDKQGKPIKGFLRMNEIFNLDLPAELAVLSACETGLGKEVQGEGIVGLTRGFMYAGTPRVVVSLWSVDDQATALLMSEFYKEILQQGKSPTAALRAAQLKMWKQESWRNPYYWAAFTLQGDWR